MLTSVNARTVRKGLWSLSVAADFQTHSGVRIPGLIGVSTAEGVEIGHAALLPDGKYVFVDVRNASGRKATAAALGLEDHETFPLTYVLRVLIGREKTLRTGSIE